MAEPHRTAVSSRRTAVLALPLALAACGGHSSVDRHGASPVVGTWLVTIPEAPFPLHMFAFHSDGTVQQSNPDAGDPTGSDSAAMGAWREDGKGIKGSLVEITADRATRQFVSRGEISFSLQVEGNALRGTATAIFYDASGQRVRGPVPATLEGRRVLP